MEELIELIKMMPSIIFRGVANQLDPAYKEMRQHYLNCDIKQLSHRGTKYGGTVDYKLVNGLYLKGRPKGSGKADQSLMQKGNGKYVPLFPGALVDILDSVAEIPDFPEFGRKLGISIAKLVTYIYSGNAPFLDPSAYFKIPCADIDYSAWTEGGRYDAGKFGRYGHPLSPFTILALSTLELESDKRLRENNCIEEIPKDDCENLDPNEIVYTSETEQAGSQGMGPTGPNGLFSEVPEEVREGERQAIRDEIEQNRALQEERDSLTEEQRRELLEQEFMSGVETEPLTQDDLECVVLRKQIRVLYNTLSEVNLGSVASAIRTQISQKKRELANLGFCVGALESFRGPTPEEQIRDYVIVRLIEGSRVVDEKQVQIDWRAKYSTEGLEPEVDGFFRVYTRQEYDNFR